MMIMMQRRNDNLRIAPAYIARASTNQQSLSLAEASSGPTDNRHLINTTRTTIVGRGTWRRLG